MSHAQPRSAAVRAPRMSSAATERGRARDYEVSLESLSQWQLAWRKFKKHRLALIGLGSCWSSFVVAIVGPILLPFDFNDDPAARTSIVYAGPAAVAASTRSGRPAASSATSCTLVVNGARMSLLIGFASMFIGVFIGTIVGVDRGLSSAASSTTS